MKAIRLLPVRALRDNYIWIVADAAGDAVLVDPGEAAPVLAVLEAERLHLRAILLTHHHPDHTGGVEDLVEGRADVVVAAPHDARIACATIRVADGETLRLDAPDLAFDVIGVPGHTLSHIAFHGNDLLFCGDTLFSVGCGRLFEGTPAQMLASLDRLAALPPSTRVCCGHEYTLANCAFALTVDAGNAHLRRRAADARELQARGEPSLPTLLADELACNPFLRVDAPPIVAALGAGDRVERFAELRRMKDAFRA